MNKYIKTDIEQGISFIKVAINNALSDLEEGREEEIHFGYSLPLLLIIHCAEEEVGKMIMKMIGLMVGK